MSSFTQLVKERDAVVPLGAQSVNNTAVYSGSIDMSKFHRVAAYVVKGVGAGNINIGLVESANSNLAGNTAIAGTLTGSYNTASCVLGTECNATQTTKRYVGMVVNEGAALAATLAGLLIGTIPRFGPQSTDDTAVVKERAAP